MDFLLASVGLLHSSTTRTLRIAVLPASDPEAAGVERIPSLPMMNFPTPFADPILRIVCTVSGEKNRPSPPMTSVAPFGSIESKMAWIKFSV